MTIEQFSALVELMPLIEKTLEKKGERIPRPNYDSAAKDPPAGDHEEQEHEESEAEAPTENVKAKVQNGKRKKANIEATSDEDEG